MNTSDRYYLKNEDYHKALMMGILYATGMVLMLIVVSGAVALSMGNFLTDKNDYYDYEKQMCIKP